MKVSKGFVGLFRLRSHVVLVVFVAIISCSCSRFGPESKLESNSSTSQFLVELLPSSNGLPSTTENLATANPPIEQIDKPRLLMELDPASIELQVPASDSLPVYVGIFLTTYNAPTETAHLEEEAANSIYNLVRVTNEILAQCDLHLELETAQVIALPERLMQIQGNGKGSWGGHPLPGIEDPELFNYAQNERLTSDTRELFSYGKQHTSPNTIAVFTVKHITYYVKQHRNFAGGLSFPPNTYHHEDDYPLRNSVLLLGRYHSEGSLPTFRHNNALAHEIGHMLLNVGGHERARENLMSGKATGTHLTSQQCRQMRKNLHWLYGKEAVPNPGPP